MRNGRPSFSGLQAMADHELGETPAVRLLIGSLIEPRVGPFMPTATMGARPGLFMGPDGLAYQKACADPCPRVTPTQEALYLLHRAVDADPALVEAHLRLGHVLHLINQNTEAKPHLERALRDAREQHLNFLVYMAGLFLGDVPSTTTGSPTRSRTSAAPSPSIPPRTSRTSRSATPCCAPATAAAGPRLDACSTTRIRVIRRKPTRGSTTAPRSSGASRRICVRCGNS